MKALCLDLSLTATGFVVLGQADTELGSPPEDLPRGTLTMPGRQKGQGDFAWNQRRLRLFLGTLSGVLEVHKPEVIVAEVSEQLFFNGGDVKGRYGAGAQYRAGQGLGRSMGWLDALVYQAAAFGLNIQDVVPIGVNEVKRRVTGNGSATKDAVRDYLERTYQWKLPRDEWDEAQTDALAVGIAYFQNLEHEQKMARLQAAVRKQDSPGTPGSKRTRSSSAHRAVSGPTQARTTDARSASSGRRHRLRFS